MKSGSGFEIINFKYTVKIKTSQFCLLMLFSRKANLKVGLKLRKGKKSLKFNFQLLQLDYKFVYKLDIHEQC